MNLSGGRAWGTASLAIDSPLTDTLGLSALRAEHGSSPKHGALEGNSN